MKITSSSKALETIYQRYRDEGREKESRRGYEADGGGDGGGGQGAAKGDSLGCLSKCLFEAPLAVTVGREVPWLRKGWPQGGGVKDRKC